ncbi:putative sigma factor for late transcription [Campylobacter phage F336]|uniref:Putative sigma factor for late transcription n=1 Tax=Campylobacter phage F336 TaxID=2794361 RepID=A0A7T3N2L8_9CAUD|nr:putative sigma factor for late transcription [Campylobacter phage F336]
MDYLKEEDLRDEIVKLQKVEKLKELLKIENKTDDDIQQIEKLREEGISEHYKKTKFGEMCLLLIKHILTMPKFSGYTYKDDFYSNATEKLMLYVIPNFDANKVSKISKEPVKAFAYCTQIIVNSILQVINERKAEQELLKNYYTDYTELELRLEQKEYTCCYKTDDENIEYDVEIYPIVVINDKLYIVEDINKKVETDLNLDTSKRYFIVNENIIQSNTLWDILKDIDNNKTVKMIYHHDYLLKTDEYNKITGKNFKTLDIMKFRNIYVPSFPKKEKKTVESELDIWEN